MNGDFASIMSAKAKQMPSIALPSGRQSAMKFTGRKEQRQQHAQSVRAREEARTNASIVLTVSS